VYGRMQMKQGGLSRGKGGIRFTKGSRTVMTLKTQVLEIGWVIHCRIHLGRPSTWEKYAKLAPRYNKRSSRGGQNGRVYPLEGNLMAWLHGVGGRLARVTSPKQGDVGGKRDHFHKDTSSRLVQKSSIRELPDEPLNSVKTGSRENTNLNKPSLASSRMGGGPVGARSGYSSQNGIEGAGGVSARTIRLV